MTGTAVTHPNRGDIALADRMPNDVLESRRPPTSVRSLLFWLFLTGVLLFGGFGTWMSVAPIQGAVVAPGQFAVDGDPRVVQHLEGGIVRDILVKDGDQVTEGQVLAVLDATRSQAQINLLTIQLASALARQSRLKAEFARSDEIALDPELLEMIEADPTLGDVVRSQVDLFRSNRETDEGQIAILTDRIDQMDGQRAGATERLRALEEQLALVRDEIEDLERLFENGLTTRQRLVQRQETAARLLGNIGESQNEIRSISNEISEYRERILQVQRDRRVTIADQLQTLQENVFDIRQRLNATRRLAENLVIRAPISGTIVGFDLNTIGSVVEPMQVLTRILPVDSEYVVTARVFPGDIDQVKVGSGARVRLSAYSYRKTPPIEGKVTYVSADTFMDEATRAPYYEVTVVLPEAELAAIPEVTPQSSMPAQVMIATREQTILTYLLDPVLGSLEVAMRETE